MYLQREQRKILALKDFEVNGRKFKKGEVLHTEYRCRYLYGHYECLIKARRE